MPYLIQLNTYGDEAGRLTVFEKIFDGDVKRAFYIYGVAPSEVRAAHGHHKATNALMCLAGRCSVYVKNKLSEFDFVMQHPDQCLILDPGDWHSISNFSSDAVVLVLSDHLYDKADYIHDKP